MNHRHLFSFSRTCWIKIEVLHFRERWYSVASENVTNITFSGSIKFSVVTMHRLNLSRSMRKLCFFCIYDNKDADQGICFPCRIVHLLYFQNPNFQVFNLILWLRGLASVGSGQNPEYSFSRDTVQSSDK